jgi:CheY-like chemotaxis protein
MSPLGNIGDSLSPLILVVDDHADHRDVYSTMLRFSGFRTEEAENGAVASESEKAITFAPDAILLDHAMPFMDGREAARRLRGD